VREAFPALKKSFAKKKIDLRLISAATGEGIRDLLVDLYRLVTGKKSVEDWDVEPTKPSATDIPPPLEKKRSPAKKKKAPPKKKPKVRTGAKAINNRRARPTKKKKSGR
jgi:hypothetical protein